MVNQPLNHDEHTNIQCLSFLVLFSGSIPYTLVGDIKSTRQVFANGM